MNILKRFFDWLFPAYPVRVRGRSPWRLIDGEWKDITKKDI